MAEPLRIRNLAQLRLVIASGTGLVITDTARPRVFHADPDGCTHVRESSFETKVIINEGKNGGYYAVESYAQASELWPSTTRCRSKACSAAVTGLLESEVMTVASLLESATGRAEVRNRSDPPQGAEVLMKAWESSQRVALGQRDGELLLCSWPGELQAQARAFYGSDRAERVSSLLEAGERGWIATPRPHLSYNGARRRDRFYFRCPLSPADYLAGWSRSSDLERAGGHPADTVREELWPWLCERGYADETDPDAVAELERFIARLERRRSQAHLRPSLELCCRLAGFGEVPSAQLQEEVADRFRQLATVLDEPTG